MIDKRNLMNIRKYTCKYWIKFIKWIRGMIYFTAHLIVVVFSVLFCLLASYAVGNMHGFLISSVILGSISFSFWLMYRLGKRVFMMMSLRGLAYCIGVPATLFFQEVLRIVSNNEGFWIAMSYLYLASIVVFILGYLMHIVLLRLLD